MTPFNKPFIVGNELNYISDAVSRGHLSGDGYYTLECHRWLEEKFNIKKALLTHSCTAALEMTALLSKIKPGDEVIMPSYTFVSTANAFALRGAIPVWCDIRPDTLNIDETKIEELITERTRAVIVVHYAGVAAEMQHIMEITSCRGIYVIEDAAQAIGSTVNGQYLGTIGHFGTYSFHETKNFISGEGGALAINDSSFIEQAEIIREKGTNRSLFFRGEVDKYTWIDLGSSYLPSEIIAAFLFAQLDKYEQIYSRRKEIYACYHDGLFPLENQGLLRLPTIPINCNHNAHLFYLILNDTASRNALIKYLGKNDVLTVFHYIPLHSSPGGRKYGSCRQSMEFTESCAERIIRLPCFYELEIEEVERIIDLIHRFFKSFNHASST